MRRPSLAAALLLLAGLAGAEAMRRPSLAAALLLVARLAGAEEADTVCRSECAQARRRLDPLRACRRSLREAAARGSPSNAAGNACLTSFHRAFADECHSACKHRDDVAFTSRLADAHSSHAGCGGADDERACAAGYAAGAAQTRAFFFSPPPPPPPPTAAEAAAPVPEEIIEVAYPGAGTAVLERYAGQTLRDAAEAWCAANDFELTACVRICLLKAQASRAGLAPGQEGKGIHRLR
ncbi:hypothetical protein M885DRAFT_504789 [Pelagophyceae sp. CCMP2097]|nr:hypothetical protein M885DRAFT_504789 [Pelagophyceae sp. CCMP2097]